MVLTETQPHDSTPMLLWKQKILPPPHVKRDEEETCENLKTEECEVHSVLNGRFAVMRWHVLSTFVLDAPPGVINGLSSQRRTYAPSTFARAVSLSAATIRMHGEKLVWDVVSRCDVDVTKGGIAIEVLKM